MGKFGETRGGVGSGVLEHKSGNISKTRVCCIASDSTPHSAKMHLKFIKRHYFR